MPALISPRMSIPDFPFTFFLYGVLFAAVPGQHLAVKIF